MGTSDCVEGAPVLGRREVCELVLHSIQLHFPQFVEETRERALGLVDRAYEWADQQFGLEEARDWANGFVVPPDYVEADVAAFRAAGNSIKEMARRARDGRREGRLSAARVEAVVSQQNPERDKLWEMATVGITVLQPESFVPSGMAGRPRLRKKLLEAGGAVEKMIVENFRGKGLAAILPIDVLEDCTGASEGVHVHTLSHAPKHESRKGRNVGDLGACGEGSPLNSDETRTMADQKWGKIVNVDLGGIMRMIVEFWEEVRRADPTVQWEDVVLWKMDLSGAFTLLDMKPDDVPLMAAEMQGGFVALFYCGIFGWTPMPAVFQVITRAIEWEMAQPGRLKGRMKMYVDDKIGVSLRKWVANDMNVARNFCKGLLGEGAIEEKKTEMGRRLTFIGWDVDLDKQVVAIAQKNALKAFYGFATEGERTQVPMTAIQRWASWAERYGEICWYMRPYRRVLYGQVREEWKHKAIRILPRVRTVVRLYQALLALTVVKEECFTRSLQSFVHRKPTLTIQFDGSLSGVGVTWFSRSSDGHETVLGGVAVSLRCLGFGTDTSYQNSAEFIGVVIGIVGALEHGWDTSAIHLRGDSETALKWAEAGRFRSDRVMNAATLISIIGSVYEVHIVGTKRIKSEQNWLCDGQSRWNGRERWRSLMHRVGRNNVRFREMKELKVGQVGTILDICDPKKGWSNEDEFGNHWRRVYEFVQHMQQRKGKSVVEGTLRLN